MKDVGQTKTELDTSLRHYGVVIDDEPLILRGCAFDIYMI